MPASMGAVSVGTRSALEKHRWPLLSTAGDILKYNIDKHRIEGL